MKIFALSIMLAFCISISYADEDHFGIVDNQTNFTREVWLPDNYTDILNCNDDGIECISPSAALINAHTILQVRYDNFPDDARKAFTTIFSSADKTASHIGLFYNDKFKYNDDQTQHAISVNHPGNLDLTITCNYPEFTQCP